MKSNLRSISVVFLTAIYCFSLGIVTKSFAHSDFQHESTVSQEKFIADLSLKQFCHTSQSESSINNYNKLPTPNFKNLFTGFWGIIKSSEQFFDAEFSQYKIFSRNNLINYRKSDIIFPFHYFW